MQSLVTSLILTRLDYCNSMLFGLAAIQIRRLQAVQNAAARLMFGIPRSQHISDALITLHWLRVTERIRFKTAVIVYKLLHGLLPRYFTVFVLLGAVRLAFGCLAPSSRPTLPSLYRRCPFISDCGRQCLERFNIGCRLCTQLKYFPIPPQYVFVRFFISWCSCLIVYPLTNFVACIFGCFYVLVISPIAYRSVSRKNSMHPYSIQSQNHNHNNHTPSCLPQLLYILTAFTPGPMRTQLSLR
jgi:hypothetical protein